MFLEDKIIGFYVIILTILKLSYCDQYIEWCEEPDVRRRITSGDCRQFSFLYPTPRCICVKGIASLDIVGSPELLLGDGGCFSTTAYGRHINSLRLEIGIDPNKYLVAVQSTSAVQSSSWLFHEFTAEPKLIYTDASYYVVNAAAVDLRQQFKGLPIICLQVHPATDGHSWVRHYAMKTFPRYYLLLNQTCTGGMSMDDTDLISSAPIANSGSQQCIPTCPSLEKADESTLLDMREHLIRLHQLQSRKPFQRAVEPMPAHTCESMEPVDKEKYENLNRKLILEFIRESFSEFTDGTIESRALQILDKFFVIAKRYCKAAKIPSAFLPQALRSFKVVQRELSSAREELFSREEFQAIFHLISRCQWDVSSLRMNTHGCSRQSNWVTSVYHPAGGEDHFDIPISDSYQKLSKHHLVVDVPYHVADIGLQACRRSFQRSPHLLEKLRIGMLKLFTSEAIHKFWTNPAALSNFNEHLFGPYWTESARSLLKCAEAAYAFVGNSYRPMRPNADESLQVNSTGSTTCAGARQLNTLSEFHEISCIQGSIALQSAQTESKDYINEDAYDEYTSMEGNHPKTSTTYLKKVTVYAHASSTVPRQLLPAENQVTRTLETSNDIQRLNQTATSNAEGPIMETYNTTELPDASLNDIILKDYDYEINSRSQISPQAAPILANLVPDYDTGEAIWRGSGRSVEKSTYWIPQNQNGRAASNGNGGKAKSGAADAPVGAVGKQTSGGLMIDFPEFSEAGGTGSQVETGLDNPPEEDPVLDFPEEETTEGVATTEAPPNSSTGAVEGDIIIIDWPKKAENFSDGTAVSGDGDVMVDFPYPDDVSTVASNVTEGGSAGMEGDGDNEILTIDFPGEDNEETDVHISFPPEGSSSGDGVQIDLPVEDDNATDTNIDTPNTEIGGDEGSAGGQMGEIGGPGSEDVMIDLPDEDIVGGSGGTGDIYIDLPPDANEGSGTSGTGGSGRVDGNDNGGSGGMDDGNNASTGEGSRPDFVALPKGILLDFQDAIGGTGENDNGPPGVGGMGIINSTTTNGSAEDFEVIPQGILLDFQDAIGGTGSNGNASIGVGTGGSAAGSRVDGTSGNTTSAAGAGNIASTGRPRNPPGYFFYPKRRPYRKIVRGVVKRSRIQI